MPPLETIAAFSSILTPFILVGLGALGWWIRSRIEHERALEQALHEDRIMVYYRLLEPYVIVFTAEAYVAQKYNGKTKEQAFMDLVLSVDYREAGIKLALTGTDQVIRAYNGLSQFYFQHGGDLAIVLGDERTAYTDQLLHLFATFLLEIRRSMGNEHTELQPIETLRFLINDIDKYMQEGP